MIWMLAAACWGVAEASFFFIVPDVLLTVAVIRFGLRRGLYLSVVAALFASLTGLGMWLWSNNDPAYARDVILWVPAIGSDLLAHAHRDMADSWPFHLFAGAMTGVPYKLYAVEAGARGIDPFLFVLVSFPARLARFVLTAGLAAIGREALSRLHWTRWNYAAWALVWIAVYAVYFSIRAAA
jgi:membrane protein YqaA with SNARE-associated domain